MIQEFLSSWALFQNTYLVGWLIGVLLSATGVFVVARNQIFLGAAVAQSSTLGIALTLWAGSLDPAGALEWLHRDGFLSASAVLFSIGASFLVGVGGASRRETPEAVTGWVFLISMSLSILIVSHSPVGLDEVLRLHSSSIIGATRTDVLVFSVLVAGLAGFLLTRNQKVVLLALDPVMAGAVGMNVRRWTVWVSLWLGFSVGLSMRVSGLIYTFGSLVLPAMAAKNLCREIRPMFLFAPLIALGTGIVAFVTANYFDYPPGQMAVALLGLAVLGSWGFRKSEPQGRS